MHKDFDDCNELLKKGILDRDVCEKVLEKLNEFRKNSEEEKIFNDEYQRLGKYVVNQNELLEQSISAAASAVVHLAEKAKGETSPVEEESTSTMMLLGERYALKFFMHNHLFGVVRGRVIHVDMTSLA